MLISKIKTLWVSTRKDSESTPVKTHLTLDCTGLSDDDMLEMVVDSAVIKWQSAKRRGKDPIPGVETYKVPRPGTRGTVELTPIQMLGKMFGFEKALELEKKFGSAEKAIEVVGILLDETEGETEE